jgi:hypothetical protein
MSATTAAAPETFSQTRPAPSPRPLRPRRPSRSRPAARSGRALAPLARPVAFVPAPTLSPSFGSRARSCTVEAPTAMPAPVPTRVRTRLTDRGVAVILVAGAMIVVAAVAVVGLTALRVTGDGAEPLTASYATHR